MGSYGPIFKGSWRLQVKRQKFRSQPIQTTNGEPETWALAPLRCPKQLVRAEESKGTPKLVTTHMLFARAKHLDSSSSPCLSCDVLVNGRSSLRGTPSDGLSKPKFRPACGYVSKTPGSQGLASFGCPLQQQHHTIETLAQMACGFTSGHGKPAKERNHGRH